MSDVDNMSNLPDSPDAAPPPAPSVLAARLTLGGLLVESRAVSGRDLADIARETRVPLRHLMAIEADDHRSLPALPYAIGFVKSYARAIGLNPEAAAAQFRAETSIVPHMPTALNLDPLPESRLPSRRTALSSLALLVVLITALGFYGAGAFDPAPPAAIQAEPVAAAEVLPAEPLLPPRAAGDLAPVVPAGTFPAAVPAVMAGGAVVLMAKEDVWIKIYDRSTGRRVFMGVLGAGQRFEVPADGPPLTLRAGRAGMVQISVGGTDLPALGGPVSTIDGVVLTAPALAARFAAAPPGPAVQPAARPLGPQPDRPPGD
ncbi:helix-turn-helix domain-containing protein [Sandarakinorhabdus sp.]|uniref:helix-turn-helix domain-containing protein n=1 Tax=Sandarakinorhabdus sp. TaxID=1916663 RepID=UPI003342BD24